MTARTESVVQLLADAGTGVWIFCADRIVRPVWTHSLTDDQS